MSEAYLIAAATGPVVSITGTPRAEQVRPILDGLFEKTGIPARRIEEIHWLGGDEEFWLTSLGPPDGGVARFHWPASPLLAHYVLHACGRALEAGERDLLLVAQEAEGQAALLALASPPAVGRHNLVPRARIGARLSLSGGEDGLAAARAALEQAGLDPGEVKWLASTRRQAAPDVAPAFPSAQWLPPGEGLPAGDLFLLHALAERLEKQQLAWLLSYGPQKSGLGTLVERV